MDKISPSVVCSNLNQTVDSFIVEVEDWVFVFEVKLLALDDDWSSVNEKKYCEGEEKDCGRDEVVIYLANVYHCYDSGDWSFDIVDERKCERVVKDAEIV